MSDRVNITSRDRVAEVMLNRPGKLNAIDLETFDALAEAADAVGRDRSIRAVILHGAGEHFCAGIDLDVFRTSMKELADAVLTPLAPSPANRFQRAAYAFRELEIPVVCALQGVVFGAGFQVAMGADLRVAAPGTQFSIMESKWGLIPDMALTTTLRGIVPPDRIKELAWTARIFDAAEALSLGIVTRIEESPLDVARALARELAGRSPDAVRGIKQLVNDAWQLDDASALLLEAELQLGLMGQPNQQEAVRANLEKREPDFED